MGMGAVGLRVLERVSGRLAGALATGEVEISSIKEVELEDLLDRGQRKLDRTIVHENLTGSRVMVTGAGGSIGSELCRQIAQY